MPEQLTALRTIDRSDIVAALDEMRAHEIRLFTNLTLVALQDCLALTPPARPVVSLVLRDERTIEQCIEAALAQTARAVAQLWPFLWGGEDFSALRDDALSRAHLPIRLGDLAKRVPVVRPGPACDLATRLMHNHSARLRNVPAAIEWEQLTVAFAPKGMMFVVSLPDDPHAFARIRAIEWLAKHGDVRMVVLSDGLEDASAFDRVTFGARHVANAPTNEADEALSEPTDLAVGQSPLFVALPLAPEGQPHPMSPIEQKLYRLIQSDEELRPLFDFNRTIQLPLLNATIDIVWFGGRVAVEIDGAEHRAAAKFRADRHRDYQLMCAGYRVLRMTNEDVDLDTALAVEKIRRVVRLTGTETE